VRHRRTLLVLFAALVALALVPGAVATGTEIRHVYPAGSPAEGGTPVPVGEPMVVEGVTILQPDENAITVDLRNERGAIVGSAATDEWGRDGVWRVRFGTADLPPGNYTLVAEDGFETAVASVRIVRTTATPTETATATTTATATRTRTATPSPTSTPTATPPPSSTPTEGGAPGFGVAGALLALAGAAVALARDG
jgi:hypothetical protein